MGSFKSSPKKGSKIIGTFYVPQEGYNSGESTYSEFIVPWDGATPEEISSVLFGLNQIFARKKDSIEEIARYCTHMEHVEDAYIHMTRKNPRSNGRYTSEFGDWATLGWHVFDPFPFYDKGASTFSEAY